MIGDVVVNFIEVNNGDALLWTSDSSLWAEVTHVLPQIASEKVCIPAPEMTAHNGPDTPTMVNLHDTLLSTQAMVASVHFM